MRREATARRASASLAIATVGLVAAAAAAGAVALGPHIGGGEDSGVTGFETEVPEALADGTSLPPVPESLADTVERPIVVAERRDELPSGVDCGHGARWEDEPEVETVLVTPTGLEATQTGLAALPHPPDEEAAEPRETRATCSALFRRGDWEGMGGSMGEAGQGPVGTTQGTGSSCCSGGHGTARADISLGGEVAWILQDRGPYWLAYPVDGLEVATVSWPYGQNRFGGGGSPPPSRFRLLDEDANVIVERETR